MPLVVWQILRLFDSALQAILLSFMMVPQVVIRLGLGKLAPTARSLPCLPLVALLLQCFATRSH